MVFGKHQAALRITAVTALVVALGAIAGGAMGLLLTAIGDAVFPGLPTTPRARIYGAGAAVGAIYGALIGTPIALLMLRRVPLWGRPSKPRQRLASERLSAGLSRRRSRRPPRRSRSRFWPP